MRILGRLRPSPAMVVALIALFVAMGGIGYAAAKIGSKDIKVNAVKSRHIANGAVTKKAIHRGAVVGVKIANGTVTGRKLASNSVRASKLAGTVDGLNSVNVPANATARRRQARLATSSGTTARDRSASGQRPACASKLDLVSSECFAGSLAVRAGCA